MEQAITARLALPLLEPGQAQKEMTHNEALAMIDLLLAAGVEAAGIDAPPAAPAIGASWIVGPAPEGAWAGRAHALAGWTAGGWRFVPATEGMAVWDRASATVRRFHRGAWHGGLAVGSARGAAIPDPAGGTAPDLAAREAIAAILEVLRRLGLIAR